MGFSGEHSLDEALPLAEAMVLVVDDERGIRSLVQRTLQRVGCVVLTAQNGEEALAAFRRHSQVSAVVLDLGLPDIPGEKIFFQLRSMQPNLAVVLSSAGRASEKPLDEILSKRRVTFLPKPFTADELISKLRQVLAEPGAQAAGRGR